MKFCLIWKPVFEILPFTLDWILAAGVTVTPAAISTTGQAKVGVSIS